MALSTFYFHFLELYLKKANEIQENKDCWIIESNVSHLESLTTLIEMSPDYELNKNF
jgi:flagellar basal body rod protein FlgG